MQRTRKIKDRCDSLQICTSVIEPFSDAKLITVADILTIFPSCTELEIWGQIQLLCCSLHFYLDIYLIPKVEIHIEELNFATPTLLIVPVFLRVKNACVVVAKCKTLIHSLMRIKIESLNPGIM